MNDNFACATEVVCDISYGVTGKSNRNFGITLIIEPMTMNSTNANEP